MRYPAAIGIDIGGTTISVGLVGDSGTALSKAGQAEGMRDAARVFERAGAGDESASRLVDRAVSAVASAFRALEGDDWG